MDHNLFFLKKRYSQDSTFVAGITFSTYGRLFFKLDDYFTEEELLAQIDIIDSQYMGGHTDTAHGLQLVLEVSLVPVYQKQKHILAT